MKENHGNDAQRYTNSDMKHTISVMMRVELLVYFAIPSPSLIST